jgi:hypothetical protein
MSDEFDFDFDGETVNGNKDKLDTNQITSENFYEYFSKNPELVGNFFLELSNEKISNFPWPHTIINNLFLGDVYEKLINTDFTKDLEQVSEKKKIKSLQPRDGSNFIEKLAFELLHPRTLNLLNQIVFKSSQMPSLHQSLRYVKEEKGYFEIPGTCSNSNMLTVIIPITKNKSSSGDTLYVSHISEGDLYIDDNYKTNLFNIKKIDYEPNTAIVYIGTPTSYKSVEPLEESREYLEFTLSTDVDQFYQSEQDYVNNINKDNIDDLFVEDKEDNKQEEKPKDPAPDEDTFDFFD